MICSRPSLKQLNTFGLDVTANQVVYATEINTILDVWQTCQQHQQNVLVIGGGSNLLFLDDYNGTILVNQLKGINITETQSEWLVHTAAGENWHQFVQFTVDQGLPGLENLALIPGTVGSAPIQNIGAYGVELKDVCDYVDVLDLNARVIRRLTQADCQFGYRESIFKHELKQGFVIIAVGFRLNKQWQPQLSYGTLANLDKNQLTPRQVFDEVCHIRRTKLPDPTLQGNAGSFFKNPVITAEQATSLLSLYPNAPTYPQADGQVKLAAGWLIEQAGLKGVQYQGAAVHDKQALVLINTGSAVSDDVVKLAAKIRNTVSEKFGVWLEPEVRFIDQQGEINAVEVLS